MDIEKGISLNNGNKIDNKINKLHERALRIVYRDENTTFRELLNKDNSVTTHDRSLKRLATEMYKIKHHLAPLTMQERFTEKVNKHA